MLNAGRMLDAGCLMLDAAWYCMLDYEFRILDAARGILHVGCWMLHAGGVRDASCWMLAGCCMLDARFRILDAGSCMLDAGF